MANITYIEYGGIEHVVGVDSGLSVMQGAVANDVRGILAECGGACSCATCHVYVDPAWVEKAGEKSAAEAALLEDVCAAQPSSRLSCQIKVTDALDGLIVRVPEKQV